MEFVNQLYYGDCLDVLKELISEHREPFIDLIYIDPPFNSKRNYNVLFESIDMKDATAQKQAFADTWSNVSYLDTLGEIAELDRDLWKYLTTLSEIRTSDSAVAYLTTMAIRIHYMHRLLKDTGSFYLHCDPTMSHYLKVVCDLVFGDSNFNAEISWQRSSTRSSISRNYRAAHDIILFYSRSPDYIYNMQYKELSEASLKIYAKQDERGRHRFVPLMVSGKRGGETGKPWRGFDPNEYGKEGMHWITKHAKLEEYDRQGLIHWGGKESLPQLKYYLEDNPGVPLNDFWDDIKLIQPSSDESLGYPTQKPEELMERIIKASSNEGDIVADFFCGCGTTIAAAQKLNRKWIGADISHLAIRLIQKRLVDSYGPAVKDSFLISGFPADIGSAKALAEGKGGRLDFQEWVVEVLMNGIVNPKLSADGGWDGYLTFETPEKKEFAIIEVKSGNVNVKNIREFIHVIEAEKAAIGVFVCFADQVTKPMQKEEKLSGYYDEKTWGNEYQRLQILTVEDLMEGKSVRMPRSTRQTFKAAQRSRAKASGQELFGDD